MAEAVRTMEIVVMAIDRATKDVQKIVREVTRETEKASKAAKVAITAEDHATAEIRRIQAKTEEMFRVFSQPLSITVRDFATSQIVKITAALEALRAKAIIPVGLGTGTAVIGLGAGALLAGGIGLGIAKSVDDAADLESAMIRVNKLVGFDEGLPGGKAAIKGLEDDVQRLMIETGQTLGEVTAAYERAGSAGVGMNEANAGDFKGARKEIEDYVKISLQAASAFSMGSEETSQYLGTIANVYKPADRAANDFLKHVASGIDAVGDATLSTERDVMVIMNGVAGALGDVERTDETTKFVMTLGAAIVGTGQSADETATIMSQFFNHARTDAAKLSKALGMTQDDYFDLLNTDPALFYETITTYYNTLTNLEKADFAKIFDIRGGKALTVTSNDKFWDQYNTGAEALGPAYDAGTRISESFEKSMGGLYPQIAKLRAAFTVFKQGIGAGPAIALTGILKVVNALLIPLVLLVDKMMTLGAKIPGAKIIAGAAGMILMAGAVKGLLLLLGPTIAKLHLMANAKLILAMYTNIAKAAMQGFSKASLTALANPVVLILAIVAAVAILLYKTGYLHKAWEKFVNSPVGEDIKSLIKFLYEGAGAAWNNINARWEIMSPEVTETLKTIADVLGTGLLYYVDYLISLVEIIIAILRKVWHVAEWLYGGILKIIDFVKALPENLKTALQEAAPSIFGASALEGSALDEAFTKWAGESSIAKAHPEAIPKFLEYMAMPKTDDTLEARKAALAELSPLIGDVALDDWRNKYNELNQGAPPANEKIAQKATEATEVFNYNTSVENLNNPIQHFDAWDTGYADQVDANSAGARSTIKRWFGLGDGDVPEYATGTDYVPKTGLAFLHEGERVIPAGASGGVSMQFNGPLVRVDKVSSEVDMNVLASKLQRAMERAAEGAVKRAVAQRRT